MNDMPKPHCNQEQQYCVNNICKEMIVT